MNEEILATTLPAQPQVATAMLINGRDNCEDYHCFVPPAPRQPRCVLVCVHHSSLVPALLAPGGGPTTFVACHTRALAVIIITSLSRGIFCNNPLKMIHYCQDQVWGSGQGPVSSELATPTWAINHKPFFCQNIFSSAARSRGDISVTKRR